MTTSEDRSREIDFKATYSGQGDTLEKAMKNLRKSRQECAPITQDTQGAQEDQPADHVITLKDGSKVLTSYPTKENPAKQARRPKGKKAKPSTSIQKPKGPKRHHKDNTMLVANKVIAGEDIDHSDNSDFKSATKLKDQMTLKELKFIGYFLTGENTIERSMILAGYDGYHIKSLYRLGRKIVEKYETQAQDHRKIFREMGAGEVAVVEGLLQLAKHAKSEMVKFNAWSMIAKCLGLTKEQIEGVGGVTIIFEGSSQTPAQALGAPPALPGGEPPPAAGLPGPLRPLQITR